MTSLLALLTGTAHAALPPYTPGQGIRFETSDRRFALQIRGRMQLLQTIRAPDGSQVTQGFNLRRVRLDFSGHVLAPWSQWRMQLGFSDADLGRTTDEVGGSPLVDAYWQYKPDDGFMIRLGQFKTPFTRSFIGSTQTLIFADRSIMDNEYRFDRDRGGLLMIGNRRDDPLAKLYLSVFQGEGRIPTLTQDLSPLVMARIELMPAGAFDYHHEGVVDHDQPFRFGTGAAVARHWGAKRDQGVLGNLPSDGGETNLTAWTADVGLRYRLFSFDAVTSGRVGTRDDLAAIVDLPRNSVGWMVQAGVLIPTVPVGLAARAGVVSPFGESSQPRRREIGGSATWFIFQHSSNLTADVFRYDTADDGQWEARLALEVGL